MTIRIGCGFDVHALVDGRPLILGGVRIPHTQGLLGHSDADVLCHAIIDALLGALALGDIGQHFPDNDERYKNADSIKLLAQVALQLQNHHARIVNIDSSIVAQAPKLSPYFMDMRQTIAHCLAIETTQVSVKATTSERLGFVGREEGIAVYASVLVKIEQ